MKPRRPARENLSIRTVTKSGRPVGGFDARGIPRERARMVISAYAKAAQKIAPGHAVRAIETPAESDSGRATVSHSTKTTVSFSGVSQEQWDAIFKKKRKKK